MRVKIGDKIYDPHNQSIMIILTESDKKRIASMPKSHKRFCECPFSSKTNEIET